MEEFVGFFNGPKTVYFAKEMGCYCEIGIKVRFNLSHELLENFIGRLFLIPFQYLLLLTYLKVDGKAVHSAGGTYGDEFSTVYPHVGKDPFQVSTSMFLLFQQDCPSGSGITYKFLPFC